MCKNNTIKLLSVIIPVRNEGGNIERLISEVDAACSSIGSFEVIYIDDGSSDTTLEELHSAHVGRPWLRILCHIQCAGQSAAIRTGVKFAYAPVIATLDGDGQNDPAFLPELFAALEAAGPGTGLVQGQRVGRKDGWLKTLQSRIANGIRGRVLKDFTRDTGCGLKVFRRDVYLRMPYFEALHRFMPAMVAREGYRVIHHDVIDRPRLSGTSKYGLFDRLWVGLVDLAGVWWLIWRKGVRPEVMGLSQTRSVYPALTMQPAWCLQSRRPPHDPVRHRREAEAACQG